jgi:ABC-type amino acid transport substrate-binding protein
VNREAHCGKNPSGGLANAQRGPLNLHTTFKEPIVSRFATLFSLIVTLALVSTTTQARDSDDSTLSRIAKRGELILGTSANMAPMTFKQEDGKVVGLDIDLARLMAKSMDAKLSIRTMPFGELLASLERGDVDVVISNMTITTRRNMRAAFVGPYMTSGKCIITKEERVARAEQAEDLNTAETHMVAMAGTTSEDFVKTLLPEAIITTTESLDAAVNMVIKDEAGGMLTDYPICLSILKANPEAGFVSLFSLLTYEPIGIALPANDPLFVNWTENFLKRLEGTGMLDQIGEHWFGEFGEAIKVE